MDTPDSSDRPDSPPTLAVGHYVLAGILVMLLMLLLITLFSVPRAEAVFADMQVPLPILTVFYIKMHRVLMGVSVLLAIPVLVFVLRPTRAMWPVALGIIVCLGYALLAALTVLSVYLPMVSLAESL